MQFQCGAAGYGKFMAESPPELPSPDGQPVAPSAADTETLVSLAREHGVVMLPPVHGARRYAESAYSSSQPSTSCFVMRDTGVFDRRLSSPICQSPSALSTIESVARSGFSTR